MKSTISNLAAAHLAWMELRRSPATVQFYRYAYRRLERFLAGRPEQTFAQWSPLLADQYGKHLVEDGVRPTTVKHYVDALRTLARWSVQEGYLKRDPLARLTPIKATPATVPGYRLEDVAAMVKCCNRGTARGRRQLAMLLLFLDSGLRVSELCALRLGDLHLDKGTAVVRHGKGDKFRLVSYAPPTAEALRRYLLLDRGADEAPTAYLFPGDGGALSRFSANRVIGRLAKRAGVVGERLGCHRLRSACATQSLLAGANLAFVQQLLGHEDVSTTQRYVRFLDEDLRQQRVESSPVARLRGVR